MRNFAAGVWSGQNVLNFQSFRDFRGGLNDQNAPNVLKIPNPFWLHVPALGPAKKHWTGIGRGLDGDWTGKSKEIKGNQRKSIGIHSH